MDNQQVGVTVVVPTLNRGGYLVDCLQDLLAQDHLPLEILVVDQSDSVSDLAQHLIEENKGIISYHHVSFRGLPNARNYGWQNARHDAIVYVDDDVRCPTNLVSEHLRALKLPNVGAVAGRISERGREVDPTKRAGGFNYWTATPDRAFSQDGEYDVESVAGCNFSTWRHIAQEVGGIEEALNVGAALYEETEYSLRVKQAGYRVYYNDKAYLKHLVSPTGGCRVDQVKPYVWALAHNRAIVIRRNLKWYQQPVAFAEVMRLGLAYAFHYRQPSAVGQALLGCFAGLRKLKES